jgi:hypothetical protein
MRRLRLCGHLGTAGSRAHDCRRFRCRDCGRRVNELSAGVLNRTQYPSDVIAPVVLWRLRYRLTLEGLRRNSGNDVAARADPDGARGTLTRPI